MKVLRWILALPAAVLGSGIIYAIARVISKLFNFGSDSTITNLIYEAGCSICLGVMFVLIGANIVPKYKFASSIIFAIIGTLFSIISILILFFQLGKYDLEVIVSDVAIIAGCVGGVLEIKKERD